LKSKYIGLTGMVIAGIALSAVMVQLLWASWSQIRAQDLANTTSYSTDRLIVDTEASKRMDLVEPTLSKLVKPKIQSGQNAQQSDSTVDYAMLGKRPPLVQPVVQVDPAPVPKSKPRPKPKAKKPEPYTYRVSMTYISGDHRYAVLNGKFYRQGARLPSGEKLAEITSSAVRIDSAGSTRWITINGTEQPDLAPESVQLNSQLTTAANRINRS